MTRQQILIKASEIVCNDRENTYGSPENNFGLIGQMWSLYLNTMVTVEDVAIMMSLLKIARIKTGRYKDDNYIDLCGYAACAAEIGGKYGEEEA